MNINNISYKDSESAVLEAVMTVKSDHGNDEIKDNFNASKIDGKWYWED